MTDKEDVQVEHKKLIKLMNESYTLLVPTEDELVQSKEMYMVASVRSDMFSQSFRDHLAALYMFRTAQTGVEVPLLRLLSIALNVNIS